MDKADFLMTELSVKNMLGRLSLMGFSLQRPDPAPSLPKGDNQNNDRQMTTPPKPGASLIQSFSVAPITCPTLAHSSPSFQQMTDRLVSQVIVYQVSVRLRV